MKQNSQTGQCRSNDMMDSERALCLAKTLQDISLFRGDFPMGKFLHRFTGSYVMIRYSDNNYLAGVLNKTNGIDFSMTVDGEERQLPYSKIINFFGPSNQFRRSDGTLSC